MKSRKLTIYQITFMALMAAVTCILGPLSVPIGQVPISLTNLVIYFTVYVLGAWAGTGSYCIYLILGAVGLPIFSGFAGGLGKLLGPTGGYLVGFIFMAYILKNMSTLIIFRDRFLYNPLVLIISLSIIFGFNILVGLIPVFNTIRKSPAQILSRTDID